MGDCPFFDLQVFKDELEGLIQDQLTKGNSPTGLLALRQIADLVMASYMGGAGPLTSPISTCVSPLEPDCFSACSPSRRIMPAEYLHCQELNCQTLVILNNPVATAKTSSK